MPSHLCRIVFSLLFLHSFCFAKSVTNIIDDSNGSQIDYQPNLWAQGAGCQTCDAKPDPSQAIQGTWRDGSYLPGNNVVLTASTSFSGTSVSVYAILAHGNSAWLANKIIFLIDGQQAGSYSQPQSDASAASGFAYNQQIFAQSGLSSGSHNLVIQCGENNLGTSSTLLLDYVQYTFDDGTTTTTPTQAQSGAGTTNKGSEGTTSQVNAATSATPDNSQPSGTGKSSTTNGAEANVSTHSGTASNVGGAGTASNAPLVTTTISGSVVVVTILPTSPPSNTDNSNTDNSNITASKSESHTGAIVGAVVGVIVILLILLICFFLRRSRRRKTRDLDISYPTLEQPDSSTVASNMNNLIVSRGDVDGRPALFMAPGPAQDAELSVAAAPATGWRGRGQDLARVDPFVQLSTTVTESTYPRDVKTPYTGDNSQTQSPFTVDDYRDTDASSMGSSSRPLMRSPSTRHNRLSSITSTPSFTSSSQSSSARSAAAHLAAENERLREENQRLRQRDQGALIELDEEQPPPYVGE